MFNRVYLFELLAVILGGICEWYDFIIFNCFAQEIGTAFFPAVKNQTYAVMEGLCLFAIGYFARPFGAIFFSNIADNNGRAFCLKLTPITIALSSTAIAFLPGYLSLGIAAPLILFALRFIQGMSLGGEYCSSIVYIYEKTNSKRIGLGISLVCLSPAIGITIASFAASYISTISTQTNSWRLCFLVSLFLGLLTSVSRHRLKDDKNIIKGNAYKNNESNKSNKSDEIHEIKEIKEINIKSRFLFSIINHWNLYATIISLYSYFCVSFYFQVSYLPSYLERHFDINKPEVLLTVSRSIMINACVLPIVGLLCDKIGPKKVLIVSAISAFFLYPFLFLSIDNKLSYYIFSIISLLNTISLPMIVIKLIPKELLTTIFSVSYNTAMGFIGGTTAIVCLFIENHYTYSNYKIAPIFYVLISVVVTLSALALLSSTQKNTKYQ